MEGILAHKKTFSMNRRLQQLVSEACIYEIGNIERQKKMQEIYRQVVNSKQLWVHHVPYYKDALQEMWEYCYQHLEEYDPNRGGVLTWFNSCLKKQLRRFRDRTNREKIRQITVQKTDKVT